ncbi:hypothetical protein CSB07_01810 [Candidatus Gracilibacteria bacterium]|nr:MAG: hypothetical protein CSB07_01810 [Candidatus Gracilibacteria bacterium]PIE85206.1 MAG: hypothetical protein CSA08_03020 [Candidatus Gracilibacteria bacterium]
MNKKQDSKNEVELIELETKSISLSESDKTDVEETFNEAKDFRSLGEKITLPLDNIISKTAKVIDADPIMNVSKELDKMNNSVQNVYTEIVDNDGAVMKIAKSLPLIGILAKNLDAKWDEAKFNMKSLEGKIESIFSGFDQAYNSINTSIDMQVEFISGIDDNLGRVIGYKDFLNEKVEEFKNRASETKNEDEKLKYDMFLRNVEYFLSNLVVLIGNLEMARKRLLIRLDSASKLSLAMNSSRPIFKTLLSTALIETSSQKALDASAKAINVMGETIDKMSSELTDKAIQSAKKSEELSSKPVLSASVFVENVTKLKNHFDEIESYREQIKIQADAEKKLFDEAKINLDEVKVLSSKSQQEFSEELS